MKKEDTGRGEKTKINQHDMRQHVKDGLYAFYELNNTLPETLKVQITGEFILCSNMIVLLLI